MTEAQKAVFTPDTVTALRIVEQLAQGKDMRGAIDAVCGVGTFDTMAGNLYDQLRAKSAN